MQSIFVFLDIAKVAVFQWKNAAAWPTKWISKWRGHRSLKSIVGQHGWLTRKKLNSRRFRMAKTVVFRLWWQSVNSFCFDSFFLLYFPFLFLLRKKVEGGGGGMINRQGTTVPSFIISGYVWLIIGGGFFVPLSVNSILNGVKRLCGIFYFHFRFVFIKF